MSLTQSPGSVEITMSSEYGITDVLNTRTVEMKPADRSMSWMAQIVVSNLFFLLFPNRFFAMNINTTIFKKIGTADQENQES